jgi:hypothetical protein
MSLDSDGRTSPRGRRGLRRSGVSALSISLVAALCVLPTATSLASASTSTNLSDAPGGGAAATQRLGLPGELLPTFELNASLAGLPLEDLSAAQIAHYLAGLNGIGGLSGLQTGLLGETLGVVGLEAALTKAIEQLGAGAKLGDLTNLSELLPKLEAKLDGLLGLLGVSLGSTEKKDLSEALENLEFDPLVSSLLSSAKGSELTGLAASLEVLFQELGTGKVQTLLGSSLGGPFTATTVEGVAKELNTSSEAVSKELGESVAELPASATMLTAPVSQGKVLGVAPAVKGLALGVLGDLSGSGEEEPGSGKGGTGENKGGSGEGTGGSGAGENKGGSGSGEGKGGSGGSGGGGAGGAGSAGTPGQMTVIVDLPATGAVSSTPQAATSKKLGKLEIVSHRTSGAVAKVVLQVPAAGAVTLGGAGVRGRVVKVVKASRVTLEVKLSRAGTATLHRHHVLRVKLKASFKPTSGAASTATATVDFR